MSNLCQFFDCGGGGSVPYNFEGGSEVYVKGLFGYSNGHGGRYCSGIGFNQNYYGSYYRGIPTGWIQSYYDKNADIIYLPGADTSLNSNYPWMDTYFNCYRKGSVNNKVSIGRYRYEIDCEYGLKSGNICIMPITYNGVITLAAIIFLDYYNGNVGSYIIEYISCDVNNTSNRDYLSVSNTSINYGMRYNFNIKNFVFLFDNNYYKLDDQCQFISATSAEYNAGEDITGRSFYSDDGGATIKEYTTEREIFLAYHRRSDTELNVLLKGAYIVPAGTILPYDAPRTNSYYRAYCEKYFFYGTFDTNIDINGNAICNAYGVAFRI